MPTPSSRLWAIALLTACLAACEEEAPSQLPAIGFGTGLPEGPGASAPAAQASLPGGLNPEPSPISSPNPENLPPAGGVPFGGLPAPPRPSGASPLPSQAPPPAVVSPSPLPSPGPGQVLVLAAVGGGEAPPLPKAQLEAGAGGVQSDDQGLATVPRANGASLVARATGASTLVVADWDGAPTTLRLNLEVAPPSSQSIAQIPVAGAVEDAEGNPVVGAIVEGGDGQGSHVGPFRTDGQGKFKGLAHSVRGGDGSGFALFATKRSGVVQRLDGLAMLPEVRIGEGQSPVRFVLQAPTADVFPGWTEESQGDLEAEAWLQAPNGARCQLRAWTPKGAREPVQRFALTAGSLRYRFVRRGEGGLVASGVQALWPTGDRLQPELLPHPPAFALPAAMLPTTTLNWGQVSGAERYALRFWIPGGQSPRWEGLCTTPRMLLSAYPEAGPKATHLDLWALSGQASAARELLSLGPKGLRLQDEPLVEGRWSWRRLRLPS